MSTPRPLVLTTKKTPATDTLGTRTSVGSQDGRFVRYGYDYSADDPHLSAVMEHLNLDAEGSERLSGDIIRFARRRGVLISSPTASGYRWTWFAD